MKIQRVRLRDDAHSAMMRHMEEAIMYSVAQERKSRRLEEPLPKPTLRVVKKPTPVLRNQMRSVNRNR
jgi:hypothetical protein